MPISDWSSDVCSSDLTGSQLARRVELRRRRKEILETRALRQLGLERLLAIARQPAENLVDLGLGAPLLLRLGDIMRIHARDADRIDAVLGHAILRQHDSAPRPDRHPERSEEHTSELQS